MLFDLRSRRRRRAVQVIYAFLALIMVGGLLLVGVGTGSGGGILNAFTNNGSGSGGAVVSSQVKAALKATKADPTSVTAWNNLVVARYEGAIQDVNATTGAITKKGQAQLSQTTADWEHYLTLTKAPDPNTAIVVAKAFAALKNFKGQAGAWEIYANAYPNTAKAFECMAAANYAAKNTSLGDLAAAKAVTLSPKPEQLQIKTILTQAKTSDSVALEYC